MQMNEKQSSVQENPFQVILGEQGCQGLTDLKFPGFPRLYQVWWKQAEICFCA